MEKLAARSGLEIQKGKMVVELRPGGADKGDAVRAFMAEPEFAGARPVFVGDDVTDEHAFEAVAEMGGAGILVGPQRRSAAGYRLNDVAAVAAWLQEAAAGSPDCAICRSGRSAYARSALSSPRRPERGKGRGGGRGGSH